MKILHVLAQLPSHTGSGIFFANTISELKRYGHDQRAVFALQDGHSFSGLPAAQQYPVHFKSGPLPFPTPGMSDVMPYDSTKYSEMNSEMMAQWLQAFRKTFIRIAAEFQPEVLILHHLWALSSLAIEVFSDAKSIGICHYTELRQAAQNPEFVGRYVKNIGRLDAILSLSDAHQEEIRNIYGNDHARMITIGGGYDGALFYPEKAEKADGPVKILYAGKIDPSKGIFALLDAFFTLQRGGRRIELTVVGSPVREYARQFHGLIQSCPGIQLHSPVPQAQLAQMMRTQDIFVLPSFYEGLGLIAVEALACGLWTVATEIEALISLLGEDVVKSGAIEFVGLPEMENNAPASDAAYEAFVHALAEKLALQIGRARNGSGFPEAALQAISKHSWEKIAKHIHLLLTDDGVSGGFTVLPGG